MLDTTVLTDEQAALMWTGQEDASLLNFNEKQDEPENTSNTDDLPDVKNSDLDGIFSDVENTPETTTTTNTTTSTNLGTTDTFVKSVNDLIKDGVLIGYEDDEEIKTLEEAKELIKENLKFKETSNREELWTEKKKSFSPQIQAIIEYAEKGGRDISPLVENFTQLEKNQDLTTDTDEGCEAIVRETLKLKGFDDEEINDQVETLKDLDKLKAKAEKFKPELDRVKENEINEILQKQAERDVEIRKASQAYVQTIQSTLEKDVVGELKLERQDKAKIFGALAEAKYKSINGFNVNQFVKTLEELQFGKTANYEHFLNIVQLTIDKEGFFDKIKESLETKLTADTIRQLKGAKTVSANTDATPAQQSNRKVIPSNKLKNPFN